MPAITACLFTSLVGVVAADGDRQYAWSDEELFTTLTAGWGAASTVLVGRRSFDGYRGLQQEAPDSPVFAFPGGVERLVVTRSAHDPHRPGTEVVTEDLEERIAELTVLLIPIVVGSGERFFPEQDDADGPVGRPLHLEACHRYASGVVQLRYRPAG